MSIKNLFLVFLMGFFISSLSFMNTEASSPWFNERTGEASNKNYNTTYAFALFHSDSTIPEIYKITEISNGVSNNIFQATHYVAFRIDQNPMNKKFVHENNWQCFPIYDLTAQQYFSETNLHSLPVLIFSSKKPSTPPVPFPIVPVLYEIDTHKPTSSVVLTMLETKEDYMNGTKKNTRITFEKWFNNINNPIVKTNWIEKNFIPHFTPCNEYLPWERQPY